MLTISFLPSPPSSSKGVGIETIHYIGDDLWKVDSF